MSKKPETFSNKEQDYLAFKRNTETTVTEATVGKISTLVLEARLKTLSLIIDKNDVISEEIRVIKNELALRKAVSEMTVTQLEERLSLLVPGFDDNEEHLIREELKKYEKKTPVFAAKDEILAV